MNPDFAPIVDKKEAVFTETVRNDARVDEFKEAIADARVIRIDATQEKQAIDTQVDSLKNDRENLFQLFRFAILAIYPVAGLAFSAHQLFKGLREGQIKIPVNHPAQGLFLEYKQKVDKVDGEIAVKAAEYKEKTVIEHAAQNTEADVVQKYEAFAESADTPVPSIQQVTRGLIDKPAPTAPHKDSSFITKVLTLPGIDPQVGQYIFYHMNFDDVGGESLTSLPGMSTDALKELDEDEFVFRGARETRYPKVLSPTNSKYISMRQDMSGPGMPSATTIGAVVGLLALAYVISR